MDECHDARMRRMIARMAEIEAMQGVEMPQREIAGLQIEHARLALVVADAEAARLRRKLAEYEHRDRVLASFDAMDCTDRRALRDKKASVEMAGKRRL